MRGTRFKAGRRVKHKAPNGEVTFRVESHESANDMEPATVSGTVVRSSRPKYSRGDFYTAPADEVRVPSSF